ncbi:MAG: T9SS type A sorting domain-containing protein [Sphingobacteriales bacterium]|nr:MAG: T9SS type A sorting domain-containing protein [Sphingobacteriales bacterium]
MEAGSVSDHGTHCAGTFGGGGLINPRARGMAPKATIYSWNFSGNIPAEQAIAIPAQNLAVSTHSYGASGNPSCGITGASVAYSATSRSTDINLNNFPNHLHIHSSGNSQAACSGGWSTITGSGKSAKNNILVGDITSFEVLSGSSSNGPVADGRVKPEIVAMGTSVFSTVLNNNYATFSGTSMATPGVAGSVALLVERYRQLNAGANPPSALIKNTVLNTAHDLGNAGPDYRFGYGRLNALSAVRILEQNRYAVSSIATGATNTHNITVPASAARLRVMITWNDPAGTANANPALVNNLDLTVVNGSNTTLPFILDPLNPGTPAVRAVDNVSNIEQVVIDNPAAGSYTLNVAGTAVPVGPQQYTITWEVDVPYVEVIFPNGGESFNPGTTEVITWNNAGITGPQTVEYSLDNGGSWITINPNVAATTTRLNWAAPAGTSTSTALIRVSSGTVTDVSDGNFNILGTPTGLNTGATSCNPGELNFTWTAVAGATHYDLMRLNISTGEWVIIGSNIAATGFVATGLTVGSTEWFSLVAKNNTSGARSERSVGISRVIPNVTNLVLGPISGRQVICGATANVEYSVAAIAGATSYTWTVPTGATIVSSAGNVIQVSYAAGSSSGNITVVANAGSCQSAPVSLAINFFATAVAAPVSGGNQTQTYCPPGAMPSLTATATVPAGHEVVWYNAATNGAVVASPTLNSVGTVTYYAASRSTSTLCESNVRTAVTLTITAAPAPTITAGGPLTFCQGGSVVLTAASGVSYLWSNGATTQSITVTNGGTYNVVVNQGSGCSGTSANVVVVVNPLPTITVAASGATTFCQGGSVTLTATQGNSYLWSNGATTQSITVNTSGNYAVTVSNASGCATLSAPVAVSVSPKPAVSLAAAPYTSLFPGISTTITATTSVPVTYTWFRNGSVVAGATSASIPVSIDGTGSYTVQVTNASGCSNTSAALTIADSATARIFVYPNPNKGQFQVSYYNATATENVVSVYDSRGARIMTKRFNISTAYQRMNVDVRNHGKGTYNVVLSDKNNKKLASASVVVL